MADKPLLAKADRLTRQMNIAIRSVCVFLVIVVAVIVGWVGVHL